jgi:hypothetical protein
MLRVCFESCTEHKNCEHTLRANTGSKHCEEIMTRLRLLCGSLSFCFCMFSMHARSAMLRRKTLLWFAMCMTKFEQPRKPLHSGILILPVCTCASRAPFCGNIGFSMNQLGNGANRKKLNERDLIIVDLCLRWQ